MIVIQGEIHSSKNSRQFIPKIKRLVKSKASKADEAMLAPQLNIQIQEWERMVDGKKFPLYVAFHFVRGSRRRWDFANLVQGVADAMVKAGYIPDDDVNHFIPVYAGHTVDKHNPGVEFWIQ